MFGKKNKNPNNQNMGMGNDFGFNSGNFPTQDDFMNPNQGFNPNMGNMNPNQGFNPNMSQGFNPNMDNMNPNQGFNPNMGNMNPNQGFNPNMNQGFNPNMGNMNPNQGFNPNANNQVGKKGKKQKAPKQKAPKQNKNGKKKFNPLIILIPIILIVLLVAGGSIIGKMKTETPPVVENPPVQEVVDVETPENTENTESTEISENVETPDNTGDSEVVDEPDDENIADDYAYSNDMLGIAFNYNSNLYIKENVEKIFNTLKDIIPEGEDEFDIYNDKLPDILNIAKLTTGDADGLYISISVLPFEIEQETTTLKIDGTTEVKNESIAALDLSDAELIEKYDLQIRETLEQSNCEIVSYDKTKIESVGSELDENGESILKGIYTSRVYTGPIDVTTSTGTVDVLQCTIPVGKNAILVTAVTDGRPIAIDKTAIFNEIVSSIIIMPREVEENPDDIEGVPVVEENVSTSNELEFVS